MDSLRFWTQDRRSILETKTYLVFVVSVKELEWSLVVVEDFFWLEETIKLDNCILRRVGGVDDVFLETHTEVTADGAWSCFARIR